MDANNINIRKRDYSVGAIITKLNNGTIEFDDGGYRSSKFIEFLLSNSPIDTIVAKIYNGNILKIYGGNALIRSIYYYIIKDYEFNDLELFELFNEKRYSELKPYLQRRIEESSLTFYVDESYSKSDEVIKKYAEMINNMKE